MAEDSATVTFRQELRQTQSNSKPASPQPEADETTPLIPNGGATSAAAGSGDHGDHDPSSNGNGSAADGFSPREFFLSRRKTPGLDSPNWMVKVSSHIWHVTKVTLLSSEFPRLAPCT
jgi:Ca2+:H+ antiporter